ncbi:ABC transporter ATP-binding protein [Streptomyces sp. 8N616]|uniref:ABC transporter ATP-binding protein n=1 Tax=Streptomyces sp. 8N616 TaxID=3457414 RepID=UPI003FD35564
MSAGESTQDLDLVGLVKAYADKQVLHDVGFSVPAGRIVGFVGSNGAGKSTTMRIVLGLTSADSGQVLVDGEPIGVRERKRIGYMPEERGLYPRMRVLEQLTYLGRLSGFSAEEAGEAAGQWTGRLGLGAAGQARLSELSLGNQQRVQLAAALLHDPRMLILDEPFSGLDPTAVGVMSDVLKEQAALGKPVLFSSHQLDLVERLCDEVVIISGGRIVACGSVGALRESEPVSYRIVGDGITPGWTASLEGVTELECEHNACRVEIERGRDQELLAAAQSLGPVREFTLAQPNLTDLYRDVVNPDGPDRA